MYGLWFIIIVLFFILLFYSHTIDLRALLPKESLLNDSAPQTFKTYNEDQMIQVEVNGKKALISKYSEVGNNEYVDAVNKQAFSFDHIKQEVSNVHGTSVSTNSLRDGLEQEILKYTRDHYPCGTSGVYLKGSDVFICISAARFNNQNFWNGRWRSVWKVSGGKVTGRIRVNVHYFEDGNVQLITEANKSINAGSVSFLFNLIFLDP